MIKSSCVHGSTPERPSDRDKSECQELPAINPRMDVLEEQTARQLQQKLRRKSGTIGEEDVEPLEPNQQPEVAPRPLLSPQIPKP